MATIEVSQLWQAAFPDSTRPELYSRQQYNEDGFQALSSSQNFLMDTSILDGNQLHALALNNQIALQAAQKEYFALERQINQIKYKNPLTRPAIKDPQALLDHYAYEERKESILYGYKYDPKRALASTIYNLPPKDVSDVEKHDCRLDQDPWSQGGFVPGKRQADTIRAKADDPRNPDGWTPILKNGRALIPKLYAESAESFNERIGRYSSAGAKGVHPQPALLSNTRRTAANGGILLSGEEALTLINKPLRNTRYNGARVPQTRDVSEAPVSRAGTPKRKRGDTPSMSSQESPAAKKAKVAQPATDEQPRRKRHNQYTKARERAELAAKADAEQAAAMAMTSVELHAPRPLPQAPPAPAATSSEPLPRSRVSKSKSPTPVKITSPAKRASPTKRTKPVRQTKLINGKPFWMSLSVAEKFSYDQWSANDLLDAIADDHSWLSGPFHHLYPNLPPKVRERVNEALNKVPVAVHPTRSWAAFRTWIKWHHTGDDKRGPRKNLPKDDSARNSSAEPKTPEPAGDSATKELVNGEKFAQTGPIEIVGAESVIASQEVVEDEAKSSARPRRKVRG